MTPADRADKVRAALGCGERLVPRTINEAEATALRLLPEGSVILIAAEAEQVRQALIAERPHPQIDPEGWKTHRRKQGEALALLCGPTPKEPA